MTDLEKFNVRREIVSNLTKLMVENPDHRKHLHTVSFYIGKGLGEGDGSGIYHSIQSELGYFQKRHNVK